MNIISTKLYATNQTWIIICDASHLVVRLLKTNIVFRYLYLFWCTIQSQFLSPSWDTPWKKNAQYFVCCLKEKEILAPSDPQHFHQNPGCKTRNDSQYNQSSCGVHHKLLSWQPNAVKMWIIKWHLCTFHDPAYTCSLGWQKRLFNIMHDHFDLLCKWKMELKYLNFLMTADWIYLMESFVQLLGLVPYMQWMK